MGRFALAFRVSVTAGILCAVAACSNGPVDLQERYYLIAENQFNSVIYRVTVTAKTRMGKAKFRQGWFDTDAVDAVFNTLDADSSSPETRNAIRKQIDTSLKTIHAKYMAMLADDNPNEEKLEDCLRRLSQVRMLPADGAGQLPNSVTIEYNPTSSLVTYRSGQKLVLFLASDPDEIIGKIKNFSEAASTRATIGDLVNTVVAQSRSEVVGLQLEQEIAETNDQVIGELVSSAHEDFTKENLTVDEASAILEALRLALE